MESCRIHSTGTPSMTLKSYVGSELNLIVHLTTSGHIVDVVQKGAPVALLLGTGLHHALGFSLIYQDDTGTASDLTRKGLRRSELITENTPVSQTILIPDPFARRNTQLTIKLV